MPDVPDDRDNLADRHVRAAIRVVFHSSSSRGNTQTARVSSLTSATLPNLSMACRRASPGAIPLSMFS
jgi:hypothetical protein